MGLLSRRQPITLGVVEAAFEAERRAGSDRRVSEKKEPSDTSKVLLWALALVGGAAVALGAAQFTDLKTEFRTHKIVEEQKHEELRKTVDEIKTELQLRQQREAWRDSILRAVAKKLHVEVTETEEGGSK